MLILLRHRTFHILTTISANFFILAVLFDTQFPSDDKTCGNNYDESSCLHRLSQSGGQGDQVYYCKWDCNDAGDCHCSYSIPAIDTQTILLLAWFQLLINAPIEVFVNFVFENYIYALSYDDVEAQRKLHDPVSSSIVSRKSRNNNNNSTNNTPTSPRQSLNVNINSPNIQSSSSSRRNSIISSNSISNNDNNAVQNESKDNSNVDDSKKFQSIKRSIIVDSDHLKRRSSALMLLNNNNNNRIVKMRSSKVHSIHEYTDDELAQISYHNFTDAFNGYRNDLDPVKRSIFEKQWAFLFADQFNSNNNSLLRELMSVHLKAKDTLHHIEHSPIHVCGTEIIKLFLIDILGRDTNEAIVFERAMEGDIKPVNVISKYKKWFAVLIIFGFNFYCVFASMLYGKAKDSKWQTRWMWVCVSNLFVDIIFNCVLEVFLSITLLLLLLLLLLSLLLRCLF